jgi:ribonucleotide reductase alpha subunit
MVDGNIEAIFSYTIVHKNYDRDPDTVQYIKEAKERGDKNYQTYYDEYLQSQNMNFYFKAVIKANDEITLFSKNPAIETDDWEEVEMSDFVINKITEEHESEKRNPNEPIENNIAEYISYNYENRSIYIAGLKIFEEFGRSG